MKKRIGIVFADEMEYKPFMEYADGQNGCKHTVKRGNEALILPLSKNGNELQIHAVKCGIGKVNASSAASFLIADDKVNVMLNAGLSGAVKGLRREDIVAGSSYVEADFDLTPIGLKPGEKPGQDYIYNADEKLLSLVTEIDGIHTGRLGSGDLFLTDKEKKKRYLELFDICSFDMETAAIASVCHKANVPFLSVRKISDNADDTADNDYAEMNDKAESSLTDILTILFDKMMS